MSTLFDSISFNLFFKFIFVYIRSSLRGVGFSLVVVHELGKCSMWA